MMKRWGKENKEKCKTVHGILMRIKCFRKKAKRTSDRNAMLQMNQHISLIKLFTRNCKKFCLMHQPPMWWKWYGARIADIAKISGCQAYFAIIRTIEIRSDAVRAISAVTEGKGKRCKTIGRRKKTALRNKKRATAHKRAVASDVLENGLIADIFLIYDMEKMCKSKVHHYIFEEPYSLCIASEDITHCFPNLQTSTPFTSLP